MLILALQSRYRIFNEKRHAGLKEVVYHFPGLLDDTSCKIHTDAVRVDSIIFFTSTPFVSCHYLVVVPTLVYGHTKNRSLEIQS